MLEYIRSNSQSLGVKLAFGLIILVFIFWGVGSMQSMSPATLVASVNGEPITVIDFERAYMQVREEVRRNNPQMTSEQMQQLQLPQQVLRQLINASLLEQETKRLDLVVSAAELRLAIEQNASFHDAQGKFDPELYKRLVTSQQMRLSDYEENVRNFLLENKLRNDMTITGEAFQQEIDAFFDYTYEQRDIEYLFFPQENYLAQLSPPAEDSIKAYYESNRPSFSIPAKASIDYVIVSPSSIVKPESVLATDVSKYYEENKDSFNTEARAKVRHILLTLTPDALADEVAKVTENINNIASELKSGADFAELAKKHSQDPGTAGNGGDLDWIKQGDTVQAFNDAVFSMQAGDVSAPIRTDFGLHIIKVDETEPAKTKELAEVEADIRAELANEMGISKLREVLDNLIEANILGKDLKAAATTQGLELQNSGLLSAFELEKLLNIQPEGSAQIFATAAGVPLDAAIGAGNNTYIVARVQEKTNSTARPFEEVKKDISNILHEQAAMEKATATAAQLRKTLDTQPTQDIAAQLKSIDNVQRDSDIGELGPHADLNTALFDAAENVWLPAVYTVSIDGKQGALLARVKQVKPSQDAQLEAVTQIFGNILSMQRKEKMFQLFMANLFEKAKIEILNESYLNMVAAP